MQATLCLDNLGDLDNGTARLAIDHTIAKAIADIDDRGDDGKPRRVTIVLSLQKMDNGLIASHVETSLKTPSLKTAGTVAKLQRRGDKETRLVFQQFAPESPEQTTIDQHVAPPSTP